MYGPKDDNKKFLPWLINEMHSGTENINLTSGIQKRDFIYVDDVVAAYNLIITNSEKLRNWNEFDIGTNSFTRVKDFILLVAKKTEKKYNLQIMNKLNFGSIEYRELDIMIPEIDNSELINLGWNYNIEIEEGINRII